MKNLVAVLGRFGEGKSLKLIELGCRLAETYKLRIVANFPINKKAFIEYGISKGYKWIHNVRVVYIDILERAKILSRGNKSKMADCLSQAVSEFLTQDNAVILFDEVGVFMNARGWQSTTIDLLSAIFQLRKENAHLVCAFQNYAQVDKQLRENIQEYVHCFGISKYDKSLRLPRLYGRFAYYYDPEKFHQKMDGGYNALRSWISAVKVEWSFFGVLVPLCRAETFRRYFFNQFDNVARYYRGLPPRKYRVCMTDEQRLFRCFQSAKRLDKVSGRKARIARVTQVTYQSLPSK